MTRLDFLFLALLALCLFQRHYLTIKLDQALQDAATSQRAAVELWATINRAAQ